MTSYILIKKQKDRKWDERHRPQLSLWGGFLFKEGPLSCWKYYAKTSDSEGI